MRQIWGKRINRSVWLDRWWVIRGADQYCRETVLYLRRDGAKVSWANHSVRIHIQSRSILWTRHRSIWGEQPEGTCREVTIGCRSEQRKLTPDQLSFLLLINLFRFSRDKERCLKDRPAVFNPPQFHHQTQVCRYTLKKPALLMETWRSH